MANFLGIVKAIAKDLGVIGEAAAPAISVFNPALGTLVGKVSSMVVNAEAAIPEDGKGPAKSQMVTNGFNSELSMAQAFLKLGNRQMTYDADLLQKAIDAEVVRMNTYASLSKSIKVIDI